MSGCSYEEMVCGWWFEKRAIGEDFFWMKERVLERTGMTS